MPTTLLLLSTIALAQAAPDADAPADAPDAGKATPAEDTPPPAPPLDADARAGAEPLAPLTTESLRRYEPKHGALPQIPYGHTGFTAYTLEWGEVELGSGGVRVGALPRTQIGSQLSVLAIGAPNGQLKVDALRIGPVDLAAQGGMFMLPAGGFTLQQVEAGGVLSTRVMPRWSVHLGSSYEAWSATGTPDLNDMPWAVEMFLPQAGNWQQVLDYLGEDGGVDVSLRAVDLQLATDVRLNRRDSIIIQAEADVWSSFMSSVDPSEIPDDAARIRPVVDQVAARNERPIANTYVATASWQLDWKRASLRIGGGLSSVPYAWALQSTEFTWAFGGESRRSERRMITHWRENRAELAREARRGPEAPDQDAG